MSINNHITDLFFLFLKLDSNTFFYYSAYLRDVFEKYKSHCMISVNYFFFILSPWLSMEYQTIVKQFLDFWLIQISVPMRTFVGRVQVSRMQVGWFLQRSKHVYTAMYRFWAVFVFAMTEASEAFWRSSLVVVVVVWSITQFYYLILFFSLLNIFKYFDP